MVAPYIPSRDSLLNAWAANFANQITANPARFGLQPTDAATIQSYADTFAAAFTTAYDPGTRTKATVADKDAKRAAMLGIVRPYAQEIRNDAGVSDEDKLALGLNLPKQSRTPILVPQTQPLVSVIAATPGVHTLRFADANTPASRAKPFGAKSLQVNVGYGETALQDVAQTSMVALVTRQPFAVTLPLVQGGRLATYFARWVGVRGDFGPWSAPVSMTVTF